MIEKTDDCGMGGSSAPASSGGCCGGGTAQEDYRYDEKPPYVTGNVATLLGPVPRLSTEITLADKLGTARVRWNIRRMEYRVRPGLYAVGEPDDTSPVLVTANYKLSLDAVRRNLERRDAWVLVVNTNGINVWCAAGKGTFSTEEVVRRIREAHLEQVVSHTRIVLPQLCATGVAAHEVKAATGFRPVFGPVRASDLPAFLDSGMKATPEMRRVTFTARDRAALVGVELSFVLNPWVLAGLALLAVLAGPSRIVSGRMLESASGYMLLAVPLAVIAGAAVMPLVLPLVPGRTFSLKGALVGAVAIAPLAVSSLAVGGPWRALGMSLASVALASYVAMNFTGSSTFTSPSGVEWEMRRALPLQISAFIVGLVLWTAFGFVGRA